LTDSIENPLGKHETNSLLDSQFSILVPRLLFLNSCLVRFDWVTDWPSNWQPIRPYTRTRTDRWTHRGTVQVQVLILVLVQVQRLAIKPDGCCRLWQRQKG